MEEVLLQLWTWMAQPLVELVVWLMFGWAAEKHYVLVGHLGHF